VPGGLDVDRHPLGSEPLEQLQIGAGSGYLASVSTPLPAFLCVVQNSHYGTNGGRKSAVRPGSLRARSYATGMAHG
jgi:hypothetical protein